MVNLQIININSWNCKTCVHTLTRFTWVHECLSNRLFHLIKIRYVRQEARSNCLLQKIINPIQKSEILLSLIFKCLLQYKRDKIHIQSPVNRINKIDKFTEKVHYHDFEKTCRDSLKSMKTLVVCFFCYVMNPVKSAKSHVNELRF